jgi:ADP-heptose:LPS heptosyltransferase
VSSAAQPRRQGPAADRVARRLILRPGAIGDTIVSLPALELLRAPYTEIWAPEANAPLLRHLGEVRTLAGMRIDMLELDPPPELCGRLRSFDEIVSWYGAARDEFRGALERTGVPCRLFRALPPGGSAVHAADFYLEQVGGAPGATPRLPWRAAPGGYAVIHPFSGGARKNWPLPLFREVHAALSAGMPVHWCAGPEEALEGAARFADLGELAQWLAGASLYVGNDSGITHLAAACGVPVVAIFGPTDPAVWGPRGKVEILPWPAGAEEVLRACGRAAVNPARAGASSGPPAGGRP